MLLGAISVVVRVRDTAVVDEARCGVYDANGRPESTRQSISPEDAAKWLLPMEVVVKRKELPL